MTINRRDLEFILFEMLHSDDLCNTDRFVDYDRNAFDTILDDSLINMSEESYLGA